MKREIKKMAREIEKVTGRKASAEQVWLALIEDQKINQGTGRFGPTTLEMVANVLGE
jgi:hypothetical protein